MEQQRRGVVFSLVNDEAKESCEEAFEELGDRNGMFVKPEAFAKGGFGSIHEACSDKTYKRCPYVAKRITVGPEATSEEQFWMEVHISRAAGRNGYGPVVHQAFMCRGEDGFEGVIVMDRWAGSIETVYLSFGDYKNLRNKVAAMHADGIVHLDLFGKNVLYRINPASRHMEFAIADFGMAWLVKPTLVTAAIRAFDWATLIWGRFVLDEEEKTWDHLECLAFTPEFDDARVVNDVIQYLGHDAIKKALKIRVDAAYEVGKTLVENAGKDQSMFVAYVDSDGVVHTNNIKMYADLVPALRDDYVAHFGAQLFDKGNWLGVQTETDPRRFDIFKDLVRKRLSKQR